MSAKVVPKDPKFPYFLRVPQGNGYSLVWYTRYSVMSAKVLPKDPKYPYFPWVPQGTRYSLVWYTRFSVISGNKDPDYGY